MHSKMRLKVQSALNLEDYIDQQGGELAKNTEFLLSGRAPYRVPEYDIDGITTRWWFDKPCRPPFLREWHNHIDNYGNYMPGYCGGLSLGNIMKLGSLLSHDLNP